MAIRALAKRWPAKTEIVFENRFLKIYFDERKTKQMQWRNQMVMSLVVFLWETCRSARMKPNGKKMQRTRVTRAFFRDRYRNRLYFDNFCWTLLIILGHVSTI